MSSDWEIVRKYWKERRLRFKIVSNQMCDLNECKIYASLYSERVAKQRVLILLLGSLGALAFGIGLSLLCLVFLLGDFERNLYTEILKTSLGLVVSGSSIASWKEVLDRWIGLIPFQKLNEQLNKCDSLEPIELEVICNLAKSFLPRF